MKKRERLERAIRRHVDRWCTEPFAWGSADCLLSLSDIIKDARGYDPAGYFRGRYTSKRGAIRVTREFGGFDGALEAMAHEAGWHEIPPRLAKVGDIGILANASGAVGGVIWNGHLWLGRTEQSFTARPIEQVERAWRVK